MLLPFDRSLGYFFCAFITMALTVIFLGSSQANEPIVDRHTVEIVVDRDVTQAALLDEAEGLVRQMIVDIFAQQPDVNAVEVAVLGDRHGEIAPILVTKVSRSQWQHAPQVSPWTRYYTESTQALLQRHGEISPSGTTAGTPPIFIQNVLVPIDSPGPVPLIRAPVSPATNVNPARPPTTITSEEQVVQNNLPDWD